MFAAVQRACLKRIGGAVLHQPSACLAAPIFSAARSGPLSPADIVECDMTNSGIRRRLVLNRSNSRTATDVGQLSCTLDCTESIVADLERGTASEVASPSYGETLEKHAAKWFRLKFFNVRHAPMNYPYMASKKRQRTFRLKKYQKKKRFARKRLKVAYISNMAWGKRIRLQATGMIESKIERAATKKAATEDELSEGSVLQERLASLQKSGRARSGKKK